MNNYKKTLEITLIHHIQLHNVLVERELKEY
jgi:hypothetical protein